MMNEFRKIDKGPMPGKPVVTSINSYALYFDYKRKALEAVCQDTG